ASTSVDEPRPAIDCDFSETVGERNGIVEARQDYHQATMINKSVFVAVSKGRKPFAEARTLIELQWQDKLARRVNEAGAVTGPHRCKPFPKMLGLVETRCRPDKFACLVDEGLLAALHFHASASIAELAGSSRPRLLRQHHNELAGPINKAVLFPGVYP